MHGTYYTIGFDFSKGTKQGEMLGGGYGDYGIEDVIHDLPLNNQKALDALIIGIAIQRDRGKVFVFDAER